jgi:hypothetical protein
LLPLPFLCSPLLSAILLCLFLRAFINLTLLVFLLQHLLNYFLSSEIKQLPACTDLNIPFPLSPYSSPHSSLSWFITPWYRHPFYLHGLSISSWSL